MNSTAKKGPGRPKDESLQERRREEILDAAASLFAQHGYRSTDMEYVAAALGIAKGTIYRYFTSKEELFWPRPIAECGVPAILSMRR